MKRVVILTATELRHTFLRKAFGSVSDLSVVASFCESKEQKLRAVINPETTTQSDHLTARAQSEEDFFGAFDRLTPDRSNPAFIASGGINEEPNWRRVIELDPDVVIAFGSSIVKSPLLTHFAGRFLNVHLGLSPYYRGTGTNFWPLVNGEPEFVGATFMHMDAGVDTGLIIHQMRARMFAGDTPHQVGNRMIVDMTLTYVDLVRRLDSVAQMSQPTGIDGRYYRRRDFTPEAVGTMHANFRAGMISKYLADYQGRTSRATIVINPAFQ